MSTPASDTLSASIFINPRYKQEEYQPKYCSIESFEDFLHPVTEDTVPSYAQTIRLIRGAEGEIDEKEWGRYTQVDEYIDGRYELLSLQWRYAGFYSQVFSPEHTSIIRVIRCHYNSSGLSSAPSWTEVREGPGTGSSFIVVRQARRLGAGLLFYSNTPFPGPIRLRLTYEYGMNVREPLLREYAGKLAAIGGIDMKALAENININLDEGPWAALYKRYMARLKYMRANLFPKKKRKIWIYPSTN